MRAQCIVVAAFGSTLLDPSAAAQPAHDAMPATPLGIEETRNASGTAWQPDSTPMFMWHARAGAWRLALHENFFFGYDHMSSPRGDDQLLSINWIMGMATRPLGDGDLMLRAMFSGEPATVGKRGYPLLLQTGESFAGEPLHDRQHPHDLLMELAARIRYPIGESVGLELYGGPVGEPAIGPPAYPHRFTAMSDPLAPLGHHWFDSTHITFGVVTAGVFTNMFKVEGSWFNGREPDEDRWDFDLRALDSFSVRLSANPAPVLSTQLSYARLDSPEELEPDISVRRATASVIWNRELDDSGSDVAITAAIAQNNPSRGPNTYASLVESTAMFDDTHNVFARVEALTKTGEELVLPAGLADSTFGIGALSAGYIYDFHQLPSIVAGLGFVGTLDIVGPTLGAFYDTRTPWGGMIFLRVRPPVMKMSRNSQDMHGTQHAM